MEHIIIDCSTNETKRLAHQDAIRHPYIAVDEEFEQQLRSEQQRQDIAQLQLSNDMEMLLEKAKTDPAFAALLRISRILS